MADVFYGRESNALTNNSLIVHIRCSLSPCGHVLCMTCLLGWFKAAPPGEDDMDDEHPNALLYRTKTCPCCRTVVHSKPIPLYLIKSLASALDKSKAPAGTTRRSPPPDDDDPWAGIFRDPRDVDAYWSSDDEEDDEDEDLDEYAITTLDISQPIQSAFLDTLMMKILPTRFVDLQLSFWVHLLPPDPSCSRLFIPKSRQLLFRDSVTVKRL